MTAVYSYRIFSNVVVFAKIVFGENFISVLYLRKHLFFMLNLIVN